ncbi:hypothetical protein C0995_011040 [Termitomyces sp. Mi166|nr:hypothetical protein C0995_011040 [Termitomyces sp. Mi166\
MRGRISICAGTHESLGWDISRSDTIAQELAPAGTPPNKIHCHQDNPHFTMSQFDVYAHINLGSFEIALAISLVLFGVLIHQMLTYWRTYDDCLFLKILASSIMYCRMVYPLLCRRELIAFRVLEIAHMAAIIRVIYYTTVTLARASNIQPNSYALTTSIVFETLITALVQPFICLLCWTLSLLHFGGGLALAMESYLSLPYQALNTFAFMDKFGWLITLAVSAASSKVSFEKAHISDQPPNDVDNVLNVHKQHDAQYIAPTFDGRISEQKYPQTTVEPVIQISLDLSMDISKTVNPQDRTLEVPGLHPGDCLPLRHLAFPHLTYFDLKKLIQKSNHF